MQEDGVGARSIDHVGAGAAHRDVALRPPALQGAVASVSRTLVDSHFILLWSIFTLMVTLYNMHYKLLATFIHIV